MLHVVNNDKAFMISESFEIGLDQPAGTHPGREDGPYILSCTRIGGPKEPRLLETYQKKTINLGVCIDNNISHIIEYSYCINLKLSSLTVSYLIVSKHL